MNIQRSKIVRFFTTLLIFMTAGISLSACMAPGTLAVPTGTASFTPSLSPLPATPTSTFLPTETFTIPMTDTPVDTDTPARGPFKYVFPIQPVKMAAFVEGVASHGYPATDIFAIVGTKFVAVTDGVVDFVSYKDTWDPAVDDPATRGGLSVAIIGDDGVRYYGSHLSEIADGIQVGVRVTAGQLLGKVGKSGDARNTTSHLHFGISRPTTPDDWKTRRGQVDPYPFLIAWKDGQNVTPPLPVP